MGGTEYKGYKIVKQDHRVANTNEKIDAAVIGLSKEHLDEFSFSARTVARCIGRSGSHAIITRGRGGLKGYYVGKREDFVHELSELVTDEQNKRGEISSGFCRKFGLLIVAYHILFALDIISRSFRNTEYLLRTMAPLINDKQLAYFSVELYRFLQEWYEDRFSRESFWLKYNKRLESLIRRYQIKRPSTGLFSETPPKALPDKRQH